jgi:hypothetical protein
VSPERTTPQYRRGVTRPEPLPDQWYTRDLLVLREIADRLAVQREHRVDIDDEMAERYGLDQDRLSAITGTLRDAGFIDGIDVAQLPGLAIVTTLTPLGRRQVGLWPSPEATADRLIAALEQAIEQTPEGEQKTRLQGIRDWLGKAGRDVVVGIASGVATGQLGG